MQFKCRCVVRREREPGSSSCFFPPQLPRASRFAWLKATLDERNGCSREQRERFRVENVRLEDASSSFYTYLVSRSLEQSSNDLDLSNILDLDRNYLFSLYIIVDLIVQSLCTKLFLFRQKTSLDKSFHVYSLTVNRDFR